MQYALFFGVNSLPSIYFISGEHNGRRYSSQLYRPIQRTIEGGLDLFRSTAFHILAQQYTHPRNGCSVESIQDQPDKIDWQGSRAAKKEPIALAQKAMDPILVILKLLGKTLEAEAVTEISNPHDYWFYSFERNMS